MIIFGLAVMLFDKSLTLYPKHQKHKNKIFRTCISFIKINNIKIKISLAKENLLTSMLNLDQNVVSQIK